MPPIPSVPASLDPRDPAFVANPYPDYAQLRALGPAVTWDALGLTCFTRHAEVNALLRDRRFGRQVLHLTTRDALGWPPPAAHLAHFDAFEAHSLLELEPPAHTRLRALVTPPFVPRAVAALEPRIEALAHTLIDGFAARGSGDLLTLFAQHLPVLVIAGMLGVDTAMVPQLLAWSHDMVAIYQVRRDRSIEDRAERATQQFVAWMRTQVTERRAAPAHDVLSQLVTARDTTGDTLSDDEIITTAILLLNAGHEATVHAIGNGVAALLGARADGVRVFLAAPVTTAEEMLRFDAPLHLFTRYALEDVTVGGRRFAMGEQIALLLGSANRDDTCFARADDFDAQRHPNPHVAFGAGRHACLGAPLARLELRTAVRVLFERLPSLQLDGAPTVADTWHFRGHSAVPVRWTPAAA